MVDGWLMNLISRFFPYHHTSPLTPTRILVGTVRHRPEHAHSIGPRSFPWLNRPHDRSLPYPYYPFFGLPDHVDLTGQTLFRTPSVDYRQPTVASYPDADEDDSAA